MFKKILQISNTGRFQNYSPSGDLEFKKLTVLFAENGRGKTTLSAIFRSLKTNDPIHIIERTTLGSQDPPYVSIRTDSKNLEFRGNWTEGYADIEIFDSAFINNNVFSGEHVEHEHKKNLYRFVVGEDGVKLARKVDDCDQKIREKNVDIAKKSTEIQKHIVGNDISITDFISLKPVEHIEKEIKEKEASVEVLKKSKRILAKANLQKVVLPTYPFDSIDALLKKQLEEISKDAEEKTKSQIKEHLDRDGEEWLQKGIGYADESCPFCGQDVDGNELISAYKSYFDIAYRQHKEEIVTAGKNFANDFSEMALSYVKQIFSNNLSLIEFWRDYIKVEEHFSTEVEEVESNFREISKEVIEHLRKKHLSPLEVILKSSTLAQAEAGYAALSAKIDAYNHQVDALNQLIESKKLEASAGSLSHADEELVKLQNVASRFKDEPIQICDEYTGLLQNKKELEETKQEARKALDTYTEEIFDTYQTAINRYLELFGAAFEIVDSKTGYSGGSPSSNYCIKINDVSVGLGDTRTYGKPCFRNVLSQGDKNALAFAFFLVKLDQDQNIANKVVIFDDPISSLDGHRKTCTKQEIYKKAAQAAQCIVMSHDKYFLRALWDKMSPSEAKALQITRQAELGSAIEEWGIMDSTKGDYLDDFYKLKGFIASGASIDDEMRATARCIRPVIEGYLRIKFPEHLSPNQWLGDFIETLRATVDPDLLAFKNIHLQNLQDINDYSKKYHHRDNPSRADTEDINDGELRAYVNRALQFINT